MEVPGKVDNRERPLHRKRNGAGVASDVWQALGGA